MFDLSSLADANNVKTAFERLIGGDVFVHRSYADADITIHHTGGYLEVAGLLNATVRHQPERQQSCFERIDPSRPIFIAMRDRGDGAHLCWWAE